MTVVSKMSQSFANVYHLRQGTLKLFNPSIVFYVVLITYLEIIQSLYCIHVVLITNISKAIVSFSDYVDFLKLGVDKK